MTSVLRGLPDPVASAEPVGIQGGPPSTEPVGCKQCGKPRPELAVKHGDQFCTTRCARASHGCPLDPKTERADQRDAA